MVAVAVAIGSRSVGGVDERRRWRRGVKSEGLFESLVLRMIDLSLVVRVSNRFFQKRSSIQHFKPLLKNAALGYIEKQNKKLTRWVYSRVF